MISGAVAGVDFRNTGGADPFGEGKDLCVGLIVEVEAADQGFTFLSGKVAVTSRIMVSAPPWEQLLKITRPSGVSKTRLCSWEKESGLQRRFSFRYMCSQFLFLQSRSLMWNQINPVTWGKVPGDELDPVRILF